MLGFITRTSRDFSNPRSLVSLYHSLVQPILECGSIIWSPYTGILINRVEKIKEKMCKTLIFYRSQPICSNSLEETCHQFKINILRSRRQIADLAFSLKVMNSIINASEINSSYEFQPADLDLHLLSYSADVPVLSYSTDVSVLVTGTEL